MYLYGYLFLVINKYSLIIYFKYVFMYKIRIFGCVYCVMES